MLRSGVVRDGGCGKMADIRSNWRPKCPFRLAQADHRGTGTVRCRYQYPVRRDTAIVHVFECGNIASAGNGTETAGPASKPGHNFAFTLSPPSQTHFGGFPSMDFSTGGYGPGQRILFGYHPLFAIRTKMEQSRHGRPRSCCHAPFVPPKPPPSRRTARASGDGRVAGRASVTMPSGTSGRGGQPGSTSSVIRKAA